MATIRSTKPSKGNKYFTRKASGGYSSCIKGKPTDDCDVLANCVGFANGAFNETIGAGKEKYALNCNAENFIERAISLGLSVVKEPTLGGIMVWQKGATLKSSDGAGHVAYVCQKISSTQVKTAESGYNSKAFWTTTRNKGTGNWGAGAGYTYRGCIVNPNVKETTATGIVAEWQTVMNKSYNCGLAIDNKFGPDSQSKASKYQLYLKNPQMHNDYVKFVQKQLNKLGYGLKEDGYFGPSTSAAIKKYQKAKGLKVDGYVGLNTISKILKG